VPIEQAIVELTDAEIIIDEDTNQLIDKGQLEGKLRAGEITKVREMPLVRGGMVNKKDIAPDWQCFYNICQECKGRNECHTLELLIEASDR